MGRVLVCVVMIIMVGDKVRTNHTSKPDAVEEQYTDYPYPAYGEGSRTGDRGYYLLHTQCYLGVCKEVPMSTQYTRYYHYTIALDVLNRYLYKGQEVFDDNFRILLPGGGTGNTVVGLGEQLNHTKTEIVYLDFSLASMRIAQMRANMMGLSGIEWVNDRIENIPQLNLGKFDLIECSGVLHHLPSPQLGLNILSNSLTARGGLALMVYGRIARTGVYHLQELVRLINSGVTNREKELQNVWKVLQSFDYNSLERRLDFRLNGDQAYFINGVFNERDDYWDTEAYDRLCHKQDRAFSAAELFLFIKNAGLNFVSISGPEEKFVLSLDYQKNFGLIDEKLRRHLNRLRKEDQIAIAELVDGGVDNHNIYASKIKDSEASFEDRELIPYMYGELTGLDIVLKSALHTNRNKPNQPTNLVFRYQMNSPKGSWNVSWKVNNTVKRMLDLIEPRNRTTSDIVDIIAKESNQDKDKIYNECKQFYGDAKVTDIILLRDGNVPNFGKNYKRPLFGLSFL